MLLNSVFVFFLGGKENGSAYYASGCGLRGSSAEHAVPPKVFLRTWDGTKRRCIEQDISYVPFWSPATGDSIPKGRGPDSGSGAV